MLLATSTDSLPVLVKRIFPAQSYGPRMSSTISLATVAL